MHTLNHTANTDINTNTSPSPSPSPSPETLATSEDVRRAESAQVSPFPGLLKLARGVVWIVWAAIACTAMVLALAFLFRIAGANADASIVDWVYRSSDRAMRPFRGIFPTSDLGGQSVFDASLLFAACAYVAGAIVLDGFRRWLGIKTEQQNRAIEDAKARVAIGR